MLWHRAEQSEPRRSGTADKAQTTGQLAARESRGIVTAEEVFDVEEVGGLPHSRAVLRDRLLCEGPLDNQVQDHARRADLERT
jgi:hypothetical protein